MDASTSETSTEKADSEFARKPNTLTNNTECTRALQKTSLFFRSVLNNDPFLWKVEEKGRLHNYITKRLNHDEKNPQLYDRISDEFIILFDEDVKNPNGHFRRLAAVEDGFLTILEDVVNEIKSNKTSIRRKLRHFEKNRLKNKIRPLTEEERQELLRKKRMAIIRRKFEVRMSQILIKKLAKQRKQIEEQEEANYKSKLHDFENEVYVQTQAKMFEIEETIKENVRREKEAALDLWKEYIEEEIMFTIHVKEGYVRNMYQKFLLKLYMADFDDFHQRDLDAYVKFWRGKAQKIKEKALEEGELSTEKMKVYEMHKLLICILEREEQWKDVMKRELGKIRRRIRKAVEALKPKFEKLQKLNKDISDLQNTEKLWTKILPHVLYQFAQFVIYNFDDDEERELLLQSLCNLSKATTNFTMPVIIDEGELLAAENMEGGNANIDLTRVTGNDAEMDREMYIDLTDRFLSDADLDESARALLKVKFIIADLLMRIIPSAASIQSDQQIHSDHPSNSGSDYEKFIRTDVHINTSIQLLEKLSSMKELLDETILIAGEKYSMPDLTHVDLFLKKRTASLTKVIHKHHQIYSVK